MSAERDAAVAAMHQAIALAGGLVDPETPGAKPVRVEITRHWDEWDYSGPHRISVGKQHFRPLKSGGYNVVGIAAAIVKARDEEAATWRAKRDAKRGREAAQAMLQKAWRTVGLTGDPEDLRRGHPVMVDVEDDGTVEITVRWEPTVPEGWEVSSAKATKEFSDVASLTAGLREAVRLVGTDAEREEAQG